MTPKQAMFVAEYLIDGNATRAAMAAGFAQAGAHVTGARLLRNAKVAAAVKARQAQRAEKLEISGERVLRETAKVAFYDLADFFDERGKLKPLAEMDEDARAAIAAFETETREAKGAPTTVRKVRLGDKLRALEMLGKHLRLFGEAAAGASLTVPPGGLPAGAEITVTLVRPE